MSYWRQRDARFSPRCCATCQHHICGPPPADTVLRHAPSSTGTLLAAPQHPGHTSPSRRGTSPPPPPFPADLEVPVLRLEPLQQRRQPAPLLPPQPPPTPHRPTAPPPRHPSRLSPRKLARLLPSLSPPRPAAGPAPAPYSPPPAPRPPPRWAPRGALLWPASGRCTESRVAGRAWALIPRLGEAPSRGCSDSVACGYQPGSGRHAG